MSSNSIINKDEPTTKNPINSAVVRLVYIPEGNRKVTLAYQIFDGTPGKTVKVRFAASIFHKENKEVFVRKQHAHTAQRRLVLRPHLTEVDLPEIASGEHLQISFYNNLVKHLRTEIRKRGTGSDRAAYRRNGPDGAQCEADASFNILVEYATTSSGRRLVNTESMASYPRSIAATIEKTIYEALQTDPVPRSIRIPDSTVTVELREQVKTEVSLALVK